MKFWVCLFRFCTVIALLAALTGPVLPAQASAQLQADSANEKAKQMLVKMTAEERVGQLFLVTFLGTTFDEKSQIYDLITNHHIGGVILQRSNENFSDTNTLLTQTYALNRLLQETEANASQRRATNPNSGVAFTPQYIPLLIGISQEGDNLPNDQILGGLTTLPDLMSVGATWNPSLAEQVGAVMGEELSALGFNLFLGPSLDVLDNPQMDNGEDLGVRTFGGDPYWVGKMGQEYIAGLHSGSANRLAVISKHFPGRGSSDRSSEEEIATVRKSLEQLKQIELAPFFAVTGSAPDASMVTDGLLVSHIRYQGFQGNIRATTRPVSSDAAALDTILKLQPFTQWRDNGGVMISDNLGSQAIRKFYDPTGSAFDARTAAREAFFAGNDMLYVDRFIASGDPDMYTTVVRTLDYFTQKYREDPAFAQRVDASVERILTLKYRLYPNFRQDQIIPSENGLGNIGQSSLVTFDVARQAVTLISPDAADLKNSLPSPPEAHDRVLFLTDIQPGKQCGACADLSLPAVDALQSTVLRLYGPRAGGQVSSSLMTSYSFMDLYKYLNGQTAANNEPLPIDNDLKLADWVVVSMLKPDSTRPESLAFQRLLRERSDLLRNKKVVVFAFNSPYYLDSTDISKLSAYYAMYSKTAAFVDVAARILFQELNPAGALPVSVPGIGYDLIHATSPDPDQRIPMYIGAAARIPTGTGTPGVTEEATPVPVFKIGDMIPLHTGVIFDNNKNQVPDGTPVRFVFSLISESSGSTQQQIDTETVDGVASATYRIERPGILEIHAVTDQGAQTNLLRMDITSGVSVGATEVAPTLEPTATPTLTPTPTVTPTVTPTLVPPPIPSVDVKDWFFVLLLILGSAVGVSWFGIRQAITRWGLRWALCGVIGGMIFYIYVALDLPGSGQLLEQAGTPGVVLFTFAGILLGWLAGIAWRQFAPPQSRLASDRPSTGKPKPSTGPKSQSS